MGMIQQMQQQMMQLQKELEEATVEGTAGGGMVSAVVTGAKEVRSISIQPEAVDPDDVELLEDLVLAALQDAMTKADELSAAKLGPLAGGLNIPGLT